MSDTEKQSHGIGGVNVPDSSTTNPALDRHQKDTIRMAIIQSARECLGIPYVWGAEWTDYSLPPEALDCSEYVEGCYRKNGLKMPDGSQAQFDFTVSTGSPQPGDLGFFGKRQKPTEIYHVGMVLDAGSMIEARGHQPGSSFETGKVIIRPRTSWENWKDFLGYRTHPKL